MTQYCDKAIEYDMFTQFSQEYIMWCCKVCCVLQLLLWPPSTSKASKPLISLLYCHSSKWMFNTTYWYWRGGGLFYPKVFWLHIVLLQLLLWLEVLKPNEPFPCTLCLIRNQIKYIVVVDQAWGISLKVEHAMFIVWFIVWTWRTYACFHSLSALSRKFHLFGLMRLS